MVRKFDRSEIPSAGKNILSNAAHTIGIVHMAVSIFTLLLIACFLGYAIHKNMFGHPLEPSTISTVKEKYPDREASSRWTSHMRFTRETNGENKDTNSTGNNTSSEGIIEGNGHNIPSSNPEVPPKAEEDVTRPPVQPVSEVPSPTIVSVENKDVPGQSETDSAPLPNVIPKATPNTPISAEPKRNESETVLPAEPASTHSTTTTVPQTPAHESSEVISSPVKSVASPNVSALGVTEKPNITATAGASVFTLSVPLWIILAASFCTESFYFL